MLSASDAADLADGGEVGIEEVLAAQMADRVKENGITYVAFTATPKAKTLELFGRKPNLNEPASDGNLPEPLHVYSMRQAIEEGLSWMFCRTTPPIPWPSVWRRTART